MLDYPQLELPSTLFLEPRKALENLSKEELQVHWDWFLKIKKSRLEILRRQVGLVAVMSLEDSLVQIGSFLERNLSVRPRTLQDFFSDFNVDMAPAEMIKDELIRYRKYWLIEPSYSLAFDASIFYGDSLVSKLERLYWGIESEIPFIGYGYPAVKIKDSDDYRIVPYSQVRAISAHLPHPPCQFLGIKMVVPEQLNNGEMIRF